MRPHAYLRSRKIESDLNGDYECNVCEPLFGERRVAISQQKSGPRSDDAHDAARSADDWADLNETDFA